MFITRVLAGTLLALAVALIARRAHALSTSGALAAWLTGTLASGAGWEWAILLIGYFVTSAALSRAGARVKAARTGGIVEKGGARDAWQVTANGGVFAAMAGTALGWPEMAGSLFELGAAALAASAADTWSTELGTWLGGTPRSITTLAPVRPGTSGGITLWGSAGAVLGAGVVTGGAILLGAPGPAWLSLMVAGVAGSLADSLLGASVQARRHCPTCDRATERRVHDCGVVTIPAGGFSWLTNDGVNAAATVVGPLVLLLMR